MGPAGWGGMWWDVNCVRDYDRFIKVRVDAFLLNSLRNSSNVSQPLKSKPFFSYAFQMRSNSLGVVSKV